MSIYERQQQRFRATEERVRSEGAALPWDAGILRHQNRTDAQPGKVIARPFSRLAYIEERVRK